jgi:predicted dehydrogenase
VATAERHLTLFMLLHPQEGDSLIPQIQAFIEAVENHFPADPGPEDGRAALELAEKIESRIRDGLRRRNKDGSQKGE